MTTPEVSSPPLRPTSRVMRFHPAASPGHALTWEGVESESYKDPAPHHCGVLRTVLIGRAGERTAFHLRYFEISPGGNSSLERHRHEHVVFVLRGRGEVRLGDELHSIGYGDTVYVGPDEVHQLRNPSASEPFGFLCLVDAERDRPVAVEG